MSVSISATYLIHYVWENVFCTEEQRSEDFLHGVHYFYPENIDEFF